MVLGFDCEFTGIILGCYEVCTKVLLKVPGIISFMLLLPQTPYLPNIVLFVLIIKKRVSKRGREWSILRKFNLPTSVTRCGIKSIPEITQREATTVLNEKSVF